MFNTQCKHSINKTEYTQLYNLLKRHKASISIHCTTELKNIQHYYDEHMSMKNTKNFAFLKKSINKTAIISPHGFLYFSTICISIHIVLALH